MWISESEREEAQLCDSLSGRRIVRLDVSDGEDAIRFTDANGECVVWATDGDCCSESWWADAFNLAALRGHTVKSVRTLEMPAPDDGRTRQESDDAYGFEIVTDAGLCQLVFRNSSNGYYGGWAYVDQQGNRSWREIAGDDWSA